MFYKNWPSWLKGGIIFSLLGFLGNIIIIDQSGVGLNYLIPLPDFFVKPFAYPFIVFYIIPILIYSIFPEFISSKLYEKELVFVDITFIGFLISIIIWFIVGVIIGLIYGKIKLKKQK